MIAASGSLGLIVSGGFFFLLLAIGDLGDTERRTRHSQEVLIAANQLERLLLDLETGQRGFLLTGQERFLEPWQVARSSFPGRASALLTLAARDRSQHRRAAEIVRAEREYIRAYSVPLVNSARRGDPSAGSVATAAAGKRRVDAIRTDFDLLLAAERRAADRSEAATESGTQRAYVAAAVGLAGSIALIGLYSSYLARAIVRPIRRAALMAGRLAGGDLGARMPETGVGEIGALEQAFNVMGRSLEQSQAELTASRARIVATADETRRRIERDLHDGAQQRLVSLVLQLRAVQAVVPAEVKTLDAELDRVAAGLTNTLEELREFARGIHPGILAERGLGAALKTLARRSAVPVVLDVRVDARLSEAIEVGAYYVVSEALTNVAKHAHASKVAVDVEVVDGVLRVSVRDDGVGGADPARGSGLVGLKDRVDALAGRMSIQSGRGAGTELRVELPLAEEDDVASR
jgi:signal transduction histidine kinase